MNELNCVPFCILCFLSQAFFCGRSEYFNALLRDHFSETTADDGTPMATIRNVPVEAFAAVVYYIYTNVVQVHVSAEEYSPSLSI
jgi:ankyrin repeat/BTB/POZ domain-containing protein 1